MYYIGICDDEPVFLDTIAEMARMILTDLSIDFHISVFNSAEELKEYLSLPDTSMDLLLLDILMDGQTGIELARELRCQNNSLPIIFITSTMDFALEGYKVEATGYIRKPVEYTKLQEAIERAWRCQPNKLIVLSSPSHSVSFRQNDVLYLDIYDKELSVHLKDGESLRLSISLHSAISKLPQQQFVQCHRSYVVSLPAIISIWRYGIELKNHENIPLSKTYYATVQNALLNWASMG